MKPKLLFWVRTYSLLIDLSVVCSLTILLQTLLCTFIYVDSSTVFVAILMIYYMVFYKLLDGQTPGKMLTRLKITSMFGDPLTGRAILLREVVFKGVIGIIVPFFIIKRLFLLWSVFHTAFVLIIVLIVSLSFLLIDKRQWWERLSGTLTIREIQPRSIRKRAFIAIAVPITAAIFVINYPCWVKHENFYKTYRSYPITKETTAYAQYIKQNAQDPVDYIFDLFKTHDLVVLSERIHSEYSQYELIKRIVSDERFAGSVGNLFTECGSVSFEDSLNSYLHTSFTSEDDLNQATAILQRNSNAIWPLWTNTNLFAAKDG